MQTVQLTVANLMPEADTLLLRYELLDYHHYDRVIVNTTTVLRPDNTTLLIYIRDALPRSLCQAVFHAFKDVPLRSDNRGMAAGRRFRKRKKDGTLSKTLVSPAAPSGVFGFYDRRGREPYCRQTALTGKYPAAYEAARPLMVIANGHFRTHAPKQWKAQCAFVNTVHPDYVIPGTVFTTFTVNRSWQTRAHWDKGDYRNGFGVMAALECGWFIGGELIFPKYRIAVDMKTGGLLLADVHELHGNNPLLVEPPNQRLSFVFYARSGMARCGSAAQEIDRLNLRTNP